MTLDGTDTGMDADSDADTDADADSDADTNADADGDADIAANMDGDDNANADVHDETAMQAKKRIMIRVCATIFSCILDSGGDMKMT